MTTFCLGNLGQDISGSFLWWDVHILPQCASWAAFGTNLDSPQSRLGDGILLTVNRLRCHLAVMQIECGRKSRKVKSTTFIGVLLCQTLQPKLAYVHPSLEMAEITAPVNWVRGSNSRISSHKNELVRVQNLYLNHRYKQCISLCEQIQRPEVLSHTIRHKGSAPH